MFLRLMQSIIVAYHDKYISLLDRLRNGMVSCMFICRLWLIWLNSQSRAQLMGRYNALVSILYKINFTEGFRQENQNATGIEEEYDMEFFSLICPVISPSNSMLIR